MNESLEYILQLVDFNGEIAKIKLTRNISPITVERLFKICPVTSTVIKKGDLVMIPIDLRVASEKKPRKKLLKGEIGYSPLSRMLVIAIRDAELSLPLNYIGKLLGDTEKIKKLSTGLSVKLIRSQA